MKKYKMLIPALLVGCCAMLTFAGCGSEEKDTEVKIESQKNNDKINENKKGEKNTNVDDLETNNIEKVSTPTPIPTPTEIPLEQKKFIAIDNVNVRRAPTMDGEIIDSFATGDTVNVIGIENDVLERQGGNAKWYRVKLYEGTANELEGFVSIQYVQEESSAIASENVKFVTEEVQNDSKTANERHVAKSTTETLDLNRENLNNQNQKPVTESDTDSQSRYANPLGE